MREGTYQRERGPRGELEGLVQCDGVELIGTRDADHRALGDRLCVRLVFRVDLLGRGLALVLVGRRVGLLLDVVVGMRINRAGDVEVEVVGFLRREGGVG